MEINLTDLLKGKLETDFSAYDLASKAYLRSSKKGYLAAALLFEAASRRACSEHMIDTEKPNMYLNYITRAGICFHEAGIVEKAKPIYKEALEADWISAGLPNDLNMIEKCYLQLFKLPEYQKSESFVVLYDKAKVHCSKIGWAFPRIHTCQEYLLENAVEINNAELVSELISLIKARKPISRPTRARIKEIEASFS